MSVTYTEHQQKVIDLRDCNILVSAAAGSGKTAVLTERIVQRVCDADNPVAIDHMLIVTFTNAAAAEMRERIGIALRKRLEEEPDNTYLRKQITLLNNAQITTIDSFCLYLLRNHFHEIGLDPGFRIGDEGEVKLLKKEAVQELLENCYEGGEDIFYDLIEKYAGDGKDDKLQELILQIYEFASSHPFIPDYLEDMIVKLKTEEGFWEECGAFLKEYERDELEACCDLNQKAYALCMESGGPIQYKEAIEDDKRFLEELLKAGDYDRKCRLYQTHTFAVLSRKKNPEGIPEIQAEVKELRDNMKEIVTELKERFFFGQADIILGENREGQNTLAELLKLVLQFDVLYERKKREKNIIDFSDMEHLALRILLHKEDGTYVPSEVALQYREHFAEIMVDEYQDSNAVQELLLDSISKQTENSGNRFMVGDVKQSIYRFRLARPEIFMEKYASFDEDMGKNRKINLSKNFRSRREVIDSVNAVFEKRMIPQVGNVAYDKDAYLYYGADFTGGGAEYKTEMMLYDKAEFKEENVSDTEAEALLIAKRIHRLCKELKITDKKSKEIRNAKFSDVVILLRAAQGVDHVIKKVLEEQGIPAYINSGKGYFEAPEIQTVINFLAIINNPRQDIPLLGVMHSAIGGFGEEEIARIRICNNKKKRLYDSLTEYIESGSNAALRQKTESFLEELAKWREKAQGLSAYHLLEEWLETSGYMNYCRALPGGEQRYANLSVLLQKAKAFENGGYSGTFDFVRYIEMMKEREVDFGEANILDENANVVRIMTIHKSKGLEFPICFVAGFSKQFSIRETSAPILADGILGMGSDYIDLKLRCKRKTLRKNIIAMKQKKDGRGEDLRVLYVALTRAKEKLILVGHKKSGEQSTLPDGVYGLLKARSYMDMVLPVAKEHPEYFELCSFKTTDVSQENRVEAIEASVLKAMLFEAEGSRIWEAYRYPHKSLEGLYTKTTVSELKKNAYIEEEEASKEWYAEPEMVPYIPSFIAKKEEAANGARRGTAYHRIMELLDFAKICDGDKREEIRTLRKLAVEGLRIPASEDKLVEEDKIVQFVETKLAKRMASAQKKNLLKREQPFVIGVSAHMVSEEFPEEEDVLIQGVIDAYFEEDDELVLLDYKTDYVTEAEELVKRYRTQLVYYAQALERLTHKRVKEKLIYSFALHKVITVE